MSTTTSSSSLHDLDEFAAFLEDELVANNHQTTLPEDGNAERSENVHDAEIDDDSSGMSGQTKFYELDKGVTGKGNDSVVQSLNATSLYSVVASDEHANRKRKERNEPSTSNSGGEFRSSYGGESMKSGVSLGKLQETELNVEVDPCSHPGYMWGICIGCGQLRQQSNSTAERDSAKTPDTVALKYIHDKFELSAHEAARVTETELQKLLNRRKLHLILDLDHTLLNSARISEVNPQQAAYMAETYMQRKEPSENEPETFQTPPNGTLHYVPKIGTWTKIRPGAREMLRELAAFYDLTIYTNGERRYALAMADLLDPSGKLFEGRVISYHDSTSHGTKDLDIALSSESAVVILDDTPQVWPKYSRNVVVVKRYHFFPSSQTQYDPARMSLMDLRTDESQSEGAMWRIKDLLVEVHKEYFRAWEESHGATTVEVTETLESFRSSILKDCRVVFSRVFPANEASPETQPLWRLARSLGASCHATVSDSTTHVIAADPDTDKAKWAASRGVPLVRPEWLESCFYSWRRQAESSFGLTEETA